MLLFLTILIGGLKEQSSPTVSTAIARAGRTVSDIIDKDENKEYNAKIIDTNYGRICFAFLSETKSDKIKVLGLDSAQKTIYESYLGINFKTASQVGTK